MNPLWGHFVGIFILLMMAVFIGIWIWAWQGSHRPVFSRMAQLPMLDDMDQAWPDYARPGRAATIHGQAGAQAAARRGEGRP
ncbi:cbb3-type cytochrome c oxidase subunit 3 [Candidimonas humi]|uniref:CcoQ/FixQ family Cbb3-type cytochrome c oxidase assembly chaperone n=1 Tax=Candidimonas humi TaxID=683355 RepID=A0ABV8NT75_9BURK|nr:CcoQ/FixQ family Cbb3-type cytochrome c oxidase assembly chaperone [Candidimonas humi]MBV6305848.1 cbb3-type cytochrome c oxidase subunit 3 [Candidimonas humi]